MSANELPKVLSARDVEQLVGRVDAVEVMRAAFRSLANGTAAQPPQTLTFLPGGAGDFITYLGVLAEAKVFGAKLSPYLAQPTGGIVTAWTLLLSMETGQPVLLCDSKQLTTERTAATTALAVDLLAQPSATRLAVIGTGPVAQAHLRHVRSLRAWQNVRVHSRRPGEAVRKAFLGIDPRVSFTDDLYASVDDADVVLLCTSSGTAVLDPARLTKPALITSISTNVAKAHEVPPASLHAMDVYCDFRETTPASAGEMQLATAEHGWSAERVVADLAELAASRAARPSYQRHVFFRSIGLGLEDVAMAHAILELAGKPAGPRA